MRYLGIALGMTVALGFCMTFGTLVPPIYNGLVGGEQEWAKLTALFTTPAGVTILAGVFVCLGGIGLCGWAGVAKESELTEEEKKAAVSEFALGKGFARRLDAREFSARASRSDCLLEHRSPTLNRIRHDCPVLQQCRRWS